MSAPIKPPGGPSGPPPGIGGPEGPGGPEASSGRPASEGASPAERPEAARPASGTEAAAPAGPVREVAEALRAGQIDGAEAIDRLVQHALGAPGAQALSPALRSELEAHLRQTLADDPALAALVRDLDRTR